VGHYSKANLSDLFEYLSDEQTEGFLRTLAEGMREGGRIAYWNLLVPRARPESLAHLLKPHPKLAKALWEKDRAFFYGDFHIEEVTRG
jgi:S-adenosylmethionine-diacylglycerol 3-amino-3-carboxypropyl transferase